MECTRFVQHCLYTQLLKNGISEDAPVPAASSGNLLQPAAIGNFTGLFAPPPVPQGGFFAAPNITIGGSSSSSASGNGFPQHNNNNMFGGSSPRNGSSTEAQQQYGGGNAYGPNHWGNFVSTPWEDPAEGNGRQKHGGAG